MLPSDLPDIISDIKDVRQKKSKCATEKILADDKVKISTNDILQKCCESDVTKVYTIDLRCEKLSTMPILNEFKHLRILDISSNCIKKLDNLQKLTELKELKAFDNQVVNLSGLISLKELIVLQLQYNRITTLGPNTLATLRHLKQLRLDNNNLSDINMRDLSSCSSLTYLDVSFNKLTSISFVSCLPNLEEFYATNNLLEIIPDLFRCKKLSELRLSDNNIYNITGVKDHTSLSILDLSGNKITAIPNLGSLKQLEILNISKNQLKSGALVTIVLTCPNLEILNIAENNLDNLDQSLSSLASLTHLCELALHNNNFPIINNESKEQYTYSMIADKLTQLRLIDSISLKKVEPHNSTSTNTLLMRPRTAASGVSLRQIENQLEGCTSEIANIQSRADAMYKEVLQSLHGVQEKLQIDLTSLRESPSISSLKSCRTSRLNEALIFANTNYSEEH